MKNENNGSISEDAFNLAREGRHKVELDLRTELGHKLREILIKKGLKQRELAKLLAIQQPEVSHLFNGHFTRFTIDKLIQLLGRLGWAVKFQTHPCETE
ncbi:MAG: XRE family transcriptional regulator [Leptolyngbya sp. SIO1E4]|nr:XRE family transcriptional regulator [Leptolyngbya sp. SIO1E4]